jgi:hypothetical protein
MVHCSAFEQERPATLDRLRRLLGPDLTRLLLIALTGDMYRPSRYVDGI